MKKLYGVLFLLLQFHFAWSQDTATLMIRLHQLQEKDTAYVNLSNKIADLLITAGHDQTASRYAMMGLHTADSIHYEEGVARSKYLIGKNFISLSDYAKGMKWILEAYALYDSLKDKHGMAETDLQAGVALYSEKNYRRALEFFNRSYQVFTFENNKKAASVAEYLSGLCLLELKSYDDAKEKLLEAQLLKKQLSDINGEYECLNGLADLFYRTGQYDSSLFVYRKCLTYFTSVNADAGASFANYGIGKILLTNGKEDSAKFFLLRANKESTKAGFYPIILRSSQELASLYFRESDYKNAFLFQSQYSSISDSIFTTEKARAIAYLQDSLEISNKESQILLLNKLRQIDSTRLYLLLVWVALLIFLAILLYQRFRFKQRANQQLQEANDSLEKALRDLKSAQEQLIQSEKMASLGQLTAGVAHEINNPINFVSASINPLKRNYYEVKKLLESYEMLLSASDKKNSALQLKKDFDVDQNLSESENLLNGIEEGSRRTAQIVKGLRNFSRLDEEEMKKVNISEGIESTLLLLQNKLKHQNIEVIKTLGDVPEINGYPGQLNQVFLNLLANAIDAINENGKIFIRAWKEKNFVAVSIRDTGKGMSEEVKQKIFDPFFTTKDIGKGTGLGLSISYGIVERHNGKIEVKSEAEKGTEFIITLPVV